MTIAIVIVAPTDCELPCDCVGGGCWCALYLYIIYLYAVRCGMWCASLPLPRPPAARGAARAAELLQASSIEVVQSIQLQQVPTRKQLSPFLLSLPPAPSLSSPTIVMVQSTPRVHSVQPGREGCRLHKSRVNKVEHAPRSRLFFLGGTPVGRRGCHMPLRAVTRRGGAQPPPQ